MLTSEQVQRVRESECDGRTNRVAIALRFAGLTQVQLAEAVGESQSYVSDVVRGRYNSTTVAKAHKFAEFFGCAIEDLFPATPQPQAQAS